MKQFRSPEDFTAADKREVLDVHAQETALDIGADFAYRVLLHTECNSVTELEEKIPHIDAVSMRLFLAREPVEDDVAMMFAIAEAVGLDVHLSFVPIEKFETYTKLERTLRNDEDNLLRRPEE